jgi:hypothetical protein
LARRSIVGGTDVAHPAVADAEPFNNSKARRSGTLDDAATHAVRINQRLVLQGSFYLTIECLELPQMQTSASAGPMSQNEPERTSAAVREQGVTRSQFLRQTVERNLSHYQPQQRQRRCSHFEADQRIWRRPPSDDRGPPRAPGSPPLVRPTDRSRTPATDRAPIGLNLNILCHCLTRAEAGR